MASKKKTSKTNLNKLDQTITQITHPKKKAFIEYYRQTNGHITDSARAARIERKTYYNWLDSDEQFAMAIADAEAELNDEMRQILVDKAGSGDMTAVIFYLKNRHPDFKNNKFVGGVRFKKGDMSIEFIHHEE